MRLGKWAILLAVVCGVLLLASMTWIVERLLDEANGQWGAAIQAVTTAVLVAVTAIYVYITYQLVRVEERAPHVRLAAQEAAARELLVIISKKQHLLWNLTDLFPIAKWSSDHPLTSFDTGPLQEFGEELHIYSAQVSASLSPWVTTACNLVLQLINRILRLSHAYLAEGIAASKEDRAWNLEHAKADFASQSSDKSPTATDDWDYVTSGKLLQLVTDIVNKLDEELRDFLLGTEKSAATKKES